MKNTAENRLKQRQYCIDYYNLTMTEHPEIDALIGRGTHNNRPIAIAYTGTKGKPDFCNYFNSEEHRETYINKFIEEQKQKLEYKAERQAKKQAPTVYALPFKIGDIIYNSWGYDQTNVDFYQVTRCTKASVFIRPIKAEYSDRSTGCDMAAYLRPLKDSFIGEEIRKKYNGTKEMHISSLSLAVVVDIKTVTKYIAVGTHRGLSAHLKIHREEMKC